LGSSISIGLGIAHGLKNTPDTNTCVISLIGDSAFLHGGLLHLINGVSTTHPDLLIIILDNQTTALTGFQPHPGSPINIEGQNSHHASLKKLVSACKVEQFIRTNPDNLVENPEIVDHYLTSKGIRVLIVDTNCPYKP